MNKHSGVPTVSSLPSPAVDTSETDIYILRLRFNGNKFKHLPGLASKNNNKTTTKSHHVIKVYDGSYSREKNFYSKKKKFN